MEPVSTAILAAVTAGLVAGVETVGTNIITDVYEGIKAMIQKKYGEKSDLSEAIENLEAKPDSPSRQGVVKEEITAVQADKDPELIDASNKLLELLKTKPGGEAHIQTAIGHHIAQADRGSKATVNIKTND